MAIDERLNCIRRPVGVEAYKEQSFDHHITPVLYQRVESATDEITEFMYHGSHGKGPDSSMRTNALLSISG